MEFAITDLLAGLRHLDLIAIAIAVAAIGIMGFAVYFSDRSNATNRAFLVFALATVAYGTFNYLNYQVQEPWQVLWLLRLTLFTATWHAFSFFTLFYIFPRAEITFPRWYKFVALPAAVLTSLLTLSRFIFERVDSVAVSGVTDPIRGPALPVFGMVAAVFVVAGIVMLVRRTGGPATLERAQARIILAGAALTFLLILTFNLILPVAFDMLLFVPLAPIFFLPIILATSHAIRRYQFLNVKAIAAELLTFVLSAILLAEIVVTDNVGTLLIRIGTFSFVLAFGILLIRSVISEVSQREHLEQMTRELTDANIKLKRLDRIRSEFLSFASHQVKAPMSVVKGYAQLIGDGTYGTVPEKVTEMVGKIKESADRLIALVNNLLDLRRIEEGRMQFAFDRVSMSNLVTQVVNDLLPLAERKNLELRHETPEHDELNAMLDTEKFRQVIQNLVDNSIKYTETGWVKVAAERRGSDIFVIVSDSGRGMPADLLPQLFEQFTRERDAAKRIEGTGLGLYIAKQIVLAHQGTITAASEGPGKGSVFTIVIPAA
ncbi:MAG TPA: ATP-binding protein [Candidatus Paceibacterota bacterium]|nr:ATP-binding protein [Candidatus Paceibacterota bacterium]